MDSIRIDETNETHKPTLSFQSLVFLLVYLNRTDLPFYQRPWFCGYPVFYYLLLWLSSLSVRVRGSHPPVSMNCLVRGSGQYQELVPFVGQQPGVNFHGNLIVKWQSSSPLNKFDDDSVSDAAQFVR